MNGIAMPDITLAQITAAVTWLVGQLVVMGLVDNDTSAVVLQVTLTAVSAVWVIADAVIRNGRSRALLNPPKPPTDGDGV